MVVILHNIRSNHNVGSIFRTADAAGCAKIFLCGITPAPLDKWGRENKALTKVALGGEAYVPWEKRDSTLAAIVELKKQGYKILAIEQSPGSAPLFDVKLKPSDKYALVLGNEKSGLEAEILRAADKVVEIPMAGRKESLNVAVAFGIVVFTL